MHSIIRFGGRTAVVGLVVAGCLTGVAATATASSAAHTPPAAPTKLTATGRTTSAHRAHAKIAWHESKHGLRSMRVYRNTSDSRHGAKRVANNLHRSSFTDSSVKPGKTYWYFVQAVGTNHAASAYGVVPVVTARNTHDRVFAGRVTDGRGRPLHGVPVVITRGKTKNAYTVRTSSTGLWARRGISHPSAHVAACFEPSGAGQGGYRYGYLRGCYHSGHAYTGGSRSRFALSRGGFRSFSIALPAGAGISGVIHGSTDATVQVYGNRGFVDSSVRPASNGSYAFTGLYSGSYEVVVVSHDAGRGSTIWNGRKQPANYFDGNTSYTGDPFGLEGGDDVYTPRAGNTSGIALDVLKWGRVTGTVAHADPATVEVDVITTGSGSVQTVASVRQHKGDGAGFTVPKVPQGAFAICVGGKNTAHHDVFACWDGSNNTQDDNDDPSNTDGTNKVYWDKTNTSVHFDLNN
ncbi:hypothetical protein [uncultured Jatrophihabitans sp.]|uniref:hypothetical protein n=1 Tax=uncultured Jatrophihabitans sp. TaxID=1610747 RepID=UPI0035CAFD69